MEISTLIVPVLSLLSAAGGYFLSEHTHRAIITDLRDANTRLLNALYARIGVKAPKTVETPAEAPQIEISGKPDEKKESRIDLAPPSLEQMRNEAAILQMTKRNNAA